MRSMLRAEGYWKLTEEAQEPKLFPATLEGEDISEVSLKKRKDLACKMILLNVADDLIDTVADFTDPAKAWAALKAQFASGDQSQILTLMGQLQNLKMSEGGSVEDYIKKARELRNRLSSMGEKVTDRTLNQIALNGLPRSYEGTIQALTFLDQGMSFEALSSHLLSEHHRRQHRTQLMGEEEALVANYRSFRGRRGRWHAGYGGRSHSGYGSNVGHGGRSGGRWGGMAYGRGGTFYRPSNPMAVGTAAISRPAAPGVWPQTRPQRPQRQAITCFNCGNIGHIARDCMEPPAPTEGNAYAFAAELFGNCQDQYFNHPPDYQYHSAEGDSSWYIDSGATTHIASDSSKLDDVSNLYGPNCDVKTGGGESHSVVGTGTSTVRTSAGKIKLENVRYVPYEKKSCLSRINDRYRLHCDVFSYSLLGS